MTCDPLIPLLLYAAEAREAELSAADRQQLRVHLEECVHCRQALDEQRAVRSRVAARPDAEPPPDFVGRIVAKAATETSWSELVRWRTWTLRLTPVAAALVIVALAGADGDTSFSETDELASLIDSWAFAGAEIDARPAFTLLGQAGVGGDELLEAVLSAEPDDLPVVEDSQ